uniref:Uncharacterized protein n=1 Tax=Hyaloperonospora arabidopsidis (strain Emoy2) TaxID=559515 RepID=M4B276_HYAAE
MITEEFQSLLEYRGDVRVYHRSHFAGPRRLVGAHHVGPETWLDWLRACLPQCRRRATQCRLQVSMWVFC